VRLPERHEAARANGVAINGGRRAEVQHALAERDPAAALGAEALRDVGFAVAGRIPQREHTAGPTLQRDEQIAVWRHREVSRRAHLRSEERRVGKEWGCLRAPRGARER